MLHCVENRRMEFLRTTGIYAVSLVSTEPIVPSEPIGFRLPNRTSCGETKRLSRESLPSDLKLIESETAWFLINAAVGFGT